MDIEHGVHKEEKNFAMLFSAVADHFIFYIFIAFDSNVNQ